MIPSLQIIFWRSSSNARVHLNRKLLRGFVRPIPRFFLHRGFFVG